MQHAITIPEEAYASDAFAVRTVSHYVMVVMMFPSAGLGLCAPDISRSWVWPWGNALASDVACVGVCGWGYARVRGAIAISEEAYASDAFAICTVLHHIMVVVMLPSAGL